MAEIERRLVTALQGLLRLMGIQPGAERMRSLFRRPWLHAEFIWGWNTALREAQGGVPSAALRAAPADAVRQEKSSKGAFVLSEHNVLYLLRGSFAPHVAVGVSQMGWYEGECSCF